MDCVGPISNSSIATPVSRPSAASYYSSQLQWSQIVRQDFLGRDAHDETDGDVASMLLVGDVLRSDVVIGQDGRAGVGLTACRPVTWTAKGVGARVVGHKGVGDGAVHGLARLGQVDQGLQRDVGDDMIKDFEEVDDRHLGLDRAEGQEYMRFGAIGAMTCRLRE